jgi:hypothetical protein
LTSQGLLNATHYYILEKEESEFISDILTLRETEVEWEANFGCDRRRQYLNPYTRCFNPYVELFTFKRVITSPWDEAE